MPFPTLSVGGQVYFYDDFLGAALTGAVAGTAENSGSAAIVAGQRGGVARATTGTTSGNRAQFTTGLNHRPADGSIVSQSRSSVALDVIAVPEISIGNSCDTVSVKPTK